MASRIRTTPSTTAAPAGPLPADASGGVARAAAPTPEAFAIRCSCGEVLSGRRQERHRLLECPCCGRTVFVFPMFPGCVRWVGEPPSEETRGGASLRAGTRAGRVPEGDAGGSGTPLLRSAFRATVAALRLPARWFTVRRLLVVGCVLFVGATVWIVVQATRQDSFEEAVRVDAPAGLQAFEEGDFLEAERRLSRAVAALDGLGRSDAEAEQTRQLWREAVAWANLSPLAPHELLATAREVVIDRGPDEWQAECAARYRGRWLLFAPTTVTRRGDRYVIEWSSQDGSRIYAELPEDEPDESPPAVFGPVARAPRELALAAPIADVRLEAEGTWAVVLDAGRAIRITRFEHLPVDNAERQRLAALSEVGGPDHTPSP